MSPEAERILQVFHARGLASGDRIHPAEFDEAIAWTNGVRDEPVRQALAMLFEEGYLIGYGTAFELTDKGQRHLYLANGKRPADLDIDQLSRLLRDDRTKRNLQRYFGVGLGSNQIPPYAGGRFDSLGGGGSGPGVCDEFTPSDILAVELLSVDVPPRVALDLLEGALGQRAAAYLHQIPADAELWSDGAEQLIRDGGPADSLWRLLNRQHGIGWVTAGKLLARKRPALIPVYDDVVRCALGRPEGFWTALRRALRPQGGNLLPEVTQLMTMAELPPAVTALRALDVAVWMNHRPTHTGSRCTGMT